MEEHKEPRAVCNFPLSFPMTNLSEERRLLIAENTRNRNFFTPEPRRSESSIARNRLRKNIERNPEKCTKLLIPLHFSYIEKHRARRIRIIC
jgi:hypothetical protein